MRTPLIAPLTAAALLVTSAALGAAPGDPVSLPPEARTLRYEMRVADTVIGQPVVELGAVEALADGRSVRSLHLRAGTFGKLRTQYVFDNTVVAVLDATRYLPLRSTISLTRDTLVRVLKLSFRPGQVKATLEEGGKRRDLTADVATGTADLATAMLWLQAAKLQPGQRASVPVHSGSAGYRLFATARRWETIEVPAGSFRALPVDCALHLTQDLDPGERFPQTTWRVWLADDAWRTPVRIHASVGVVGHAVFELATQPE